MYHPFFRIFFVFLFLSGSILFAETSVEFRAAAFFNSSHRFKEIYGNVSPSYQLEANTTFCGCYGAFFNADWVHQNGRSKGCEERTKINIANFSFGLKAFLPFYCDFTGYVGIGPVIGSFHIKNHVRNSCVKSNNSKCAVGGVFKLGILYAIKCNLFLDVFVDYLYQPVHYSSHINLGGVKLGAGLGYKF